MARVIKNVGRCVEAWKLGAGTSMEETLLSERKMRKNADGNYELFSQESKSGSGEIAQVGDYFKVDKAGFPYPNKKEWFEENHRLIEGNKYEQLPKPLDAWESTEPMNDAVEFLVNNKGLKLSQDNPEQFFGAELWGAWLTAASDAVLVFYSISRDEDEKVVDADFNFVARAEFEASYHYYKK